MIISLCPNKKEMTYYNHKYNNHFIESLNNKHGEEVIKWWKSQGVETTLTGCNTREGNSTFRFYGLLNGMFDGYDKNQIEGNNVTIFTGIPTVSIESIESKFGYIIGEEVGLKRRDGSHYLFDYHYSSISSDLINTKGNGMCPSGKGIVTAFYGEYIIVEYIDSNGKKPRLGFKPEWVIKLNNTKPVNNNPNNKKQNNGKAITVQQVTPSISTGERKLGSGIRGKGSVITIGRRHLGNSAIVGN